MVIFFYSKSETHQEFSNFSEHPIELMGFRWKSVEHFYQAQKFAGTQLEVTIRNVKSPLKAKKFADANADSIREDWEFEKLKVMNIAVRAKFETHRSLRQLLLETGNEELVEKARNDYFWGCGEDGSGQNHLGQILMKLRAEFSSTI